MIGVRLVAALVGGLVVAAAWFRPQDPAPTAEVMEGEEPAVLRFEIQDEDERPIPGRLTFIGDEGPGAALFTNAAARPYDLAVRKDVVYTLSGRGAITVPPGHYTIYASRGIEWSLAKVELDLTAGEERSWTAALRHEVDTRNWISGDFHLHTLTHSGHGDSNLEERIITLAGEGVEFAVATDHNHNTDYGPTIEALGAGRHLTHVTGNEVSTPIGHFNAFPLEPDRPIPDAHARSAPKLFRSLHEESNRYDVVPIVQLNHPRWRSIDYFGLTGLDPITATSTSSAFSYDFDALEVFNANDGWGYYDADTTDKPVGSSAHSVLQDWFNLLNQGRRYTAVGNSDSHTVHYEFAGYPRNYVWSMAAEPKSIDVGEVVEAIRGGQAFTTIGPFVEFSVDGKRMGRLVRTFNTSVDVRVRVRAASWIDCDRVKIIVNGVVAAERPVSDHRYSERFDERITIELDRDAWISVLVEGDDPMDPIVQSPHRPILPLAVTNPVWVEVDGDGWHSLLEQALKVLRDTPEVEDVLALVGEDDRYLDTYLLAALKTRSSHLLDLTEEGLKSPNRRVLLAAARAAELLAHTDLAPLVHNALERSEDDAYTSLALLRALRGCDTEDFGAHLAVWMERWSDRLQRYDRELAELVPGYFVRKWTVIGYFPSDREGALLETTYGPEIDADPEREHPGKGGTPVTWRPAAASERGYLDLRSIDPNIEQCENAVAFAQTWLRAPAAGRYAYTLGTDDGCRLWVGGELVFEDPARRSASPMQQIGLLDLEAGWNRVLLGVENGTGGFGVYLRILDDAVTCSARRE
jgi:hypothetical protein